MIQALIHRLLKRRHYWRTVSFSEMAELYTSRLMTMFAINVASVLVPVFLYKIGYSLVQIGCVYLAIFALRALFSSMNMRLVARFGPKHMIFWSGLLRIPPLLVLLFIEQYGSWLLSIYVLCMSIGPSLYEISYNIDFSKVRHSGHVGKEVGTMQIIEKIAKALSPFIGGVLATLVAPQATIALSIGLFIVAGLPLLRTPEPIKTKRSFTWDKPLRRREVDAGLARAAMSTGWVASIVVWSLFFTLYIFVGQGDGIYAIIGGLASLSVIVSILAAWSFGRIVDKNKGVELLRASVTVTSATHLLKPLITTPVGVVLANAVNETSTAGYTIASTRAMFAGADESGDRLFYFGVVEIGAALGAFVALAVFIGAIAMFGEKTGMMLFFVFAAFSELLILRLARYART